MRFVIRTNPNQQRVQIQTQPINKAPYWKNACTHKKRLIHDFFTYEKRRVSTPKNAGYSLLSVDTEWGRSPFVETGRRTRRSSYNGVDDQCTL